jgi:hypothetical protein
MRGDIYAERYEIEKKATKAFAGTVVDDLFTASAGRGHVF